jgi:intracellular septation protein A
MVREALETSAQRDESGLEEPTFRGILLTGLPGFLREGFLPLGAFYGGLRLSGLAAGIAVSTVASLLIYLYERRIGRDGLLVRISLAFVLVQGAIGLAADSTTVYLAQPVLVNAAWGLAFLVSAAIRRPLAGALACAWYPFPREFRQTEAFKRVFGAQSLVWGAYFLARSGMRMAALLYGSLGSFLAVVFVTGMPVMFLLILWSIRHSMRGLTSSEGEATLDGEHTFVTLPDPGDANADRTTAGDLEVPHGLRRRARISANGA